VSASPVEKLRALKLGESARFDAPKYTSTTQLSSATHRLRAYGYYFHSRADSQGVMVVRVPRPGAKPSEQVEDLADLI
jgi:hypothetical protein